MANYLATPTCLRGDFADVLRMPQMKFGYFAADDCGEFEQKEGRSRPSELAQVVLINGRISFFEETLKCQSKNEHSVRQMH
eukprot:scaffold10331_cov188-Skeletonema_dohrnii-CCMP3373.AAC.1